MRYESTRGEVKDLPFAETIKRGIASDGGLFVPDKLITFGHKDILELSNMNYQERAIHILKYYIDDFTDEDIKDCVFRAYSAEKFDNDKIAPLIKLNENLFVEELWHGPTCAFKDMALQILPYFMVKSIEKTGEDSEIVILVATSGDTGKAALEGFKDVYGTKVVVFYPKHGVSRVQELQMITQEGKNLNSIGILGNFDDAQDGVKKIFADRELIQRMQKRKQKFSSANSINWGRLVPQIVYYFSAYADLIKNGEISILDKINFVVPTGNFGNILAAYYAKKMGLPINKLICASNENNVLTEFIQSGTYNRIREFKKTISPSMDILISSNLERLLYEIVDHDSVKVMDWMGELSHTGAYTVDNKIKADLSETFWAGYAKEEEVLKTINMIYKEHNYVIDTHTAVGFSVCAQYLASTKDMTKTVIVSTASPFKFNDSVAKAIFEEDMVEGKTEFQLIKVLEKECNLKIPENLRDLDKKPIIHKNICDKESMKAKLEEILKL